MVRTIPEWNKNLNFKEAFHVSCVPAFQNLAWKIGPERMQFWIDKIGYGDCDLSAGIDVFWLPSKGRKTVLISPKEQAQLICKLISKKLPFSEKTLMAINDIMRLKKTDRGVLYGKTGSGVDDAGAYTFGWFVGYVKHNGKKYSFACTIKDKEVMGKDARSVVETVFEKQGML